MIIFFCIGLFGKNKQILGLLLFLNYHLFYNLCNNHSFVFVNSYYQNFRQLLMPIFKFFLVIFI